MTEYIVFWKEDQGQQVSTVVDAHGVPVKRDVEYLHNNNIELILHDEEVIEELQLATGKKYAITPDTARDILGWDV